MAALVYGGCTTPGFPISYLPAASSKSSNCGTASRQHAYGRMSDPRVLRANSTDHLGVLVGAIVPLPKLEGSEMLLVYEQGVKEEL